MADRTTIQYEELDVFKDFLLSTGKFELQEPKGKYEALRAVYTGNPKKNIRYKSQKNPLILYFREKGCGFTIQSYYQNSGLFNQYKEYKRHLGYGDNYIDLKKRDEIIKQLNNK